jgi:hypothetical protein
MRKNNLDTYGGSVFAPGYITTVLAPKMYTNTNEHSIYIRFIAISCEFGHT